MFLASSLKPEHITMIKDALQVGGMALNIVYGLFIGVVFITIFVYSLKYKMKKLTIDNESHSKEANKLKDKINDANNKINMLELDVKSKFDLLESNVETLIERQAENIDRQEKQNSKIESEIKDLNKNITALLISINNVPIKQPTNPTI